MGRLWLLVGYWLLGLVVRALVTAVGPRATGVALSLELLALKVALSVIAPALLVRWLRPTVPLARVLGVRAADGSERRIARALLIAAAWFALVYGLAALQEGRPPSVMPPGAWLALLAAVHVLVEELAMRGIFLGWLADGRAFWRANLIVSALFVSMHLPAWLAAGPSVELVPMAIVLFLLSLVLGWVTRLTGTIWIAALLHLANNAMSGW
jgi:membrane protease YdiL (CAAX protease family)